MMKTIIKFDSIILGMQRFGGISNYWNNLIAGVYSIYPESKNLMPRTRFEHNLVANKIDEKIPVFISRYLPVLNVKRNDIFHTSYYRWPMFNCKAYVVTVYDFTYEKFSSSIKKHIHSLQKYKSIRRADAIICISESTKRDLLSYYDNIDSENIHVVHLGIDHNEFYCNKKINEYNKHNNNILFVGRRDGYKRFDIAVEAVSKINNFSLCIVGQSLSPEELKMLDNKLNGRWKLFENINSGKLRELYESSFAFIFPSDYEGFGLPLIESMACGCPVISSSLSSLPEVGGDAALYAVNQSPESYLHHLQSLIDSEELRINIIKSGLIRAKEFTWDKTVLETIKIYNSLR